MFHMLTCFNLKPGEDIGAFRQALAALTRHLQEHELVEGHGPIGRRQTDTLLDTDEERDHEYFVTMSFRDRAQADDAVEYVQGQSEPGSGLHRATWSALQDPVFICWQDI